jgi:hypothetical protein
MVHRCAVLSVILIAPAFSQGLSVGIVGGGSLTDAFKTVNQDNILEYSQSRDWVAGAMLELHLHHNFSIEADGLYRELHLTVAFIEPNGTHNSVSPSPVVTWEFPVLEKYRFHWSRVNPFVEAGPEFRTTGNLNATPSHVGVAAGAGVDVYWKGFDFAPVLRYSHWAPDPNGTKTNADQVELLLGISRQSTLVSHPLGASFSLGVIAGTTLTHDIPNSSNPFTGIFVTGSTQQQESGTAYESGMDSFIVGPELEFALPKNLYLEIDALNHPYRSSGRTVLDNGALLYSFSGREASTWEFPVLAKYKFEIGRFKPFVETGPSLRLPVNDGGELSIYGITAGGGVEVHWRKLKIAPGVHYTRWAEQSSPVPLNPINRNQVEFLTGFLL